MLKKVAGWLMLTAIVITLFGPTVWDTISQYGWFVGIVMLVVSFALFFLAAILANVALSWITDNKK